MLNKSFYSGAFDDLLGLGRWYNASPAAARIFDHGPSFLRHLGFCFILFIERANWLTRILHSRVIAIDQHLSNHSDALALNVTVQKFVVQRLLNHVANRALGIRAAGVKRYGMEQVASVFRAQQDKADLRAVAVTDDDIQALGNNSANVYGGLTTSGELTRNVLMSSILIRELPPMATTA